MIYKTFIPTPALSKYIKCYWTLENAGSGFHISKDRIFPDGCIELIFHFADLFKKYSPGNCADLQQRSFLHGQLEEFIDIEATGKIGVFSAGFHPAGLKPFIAFDLQEITGDTISLRDLFGKEADMLEDKILNAVSHEQRIVLLETFLLNELKQVKNHTDVIQHSVEAIIRNNGNISIDKLATSLNTGKRQLERSFIATVGLSPKLFSRITRFQNTLTLIGHKQFNSLTMVAYESGFYDQSHFIKDFKEFTGLSPNQYFSENLALVKYFNLV